MYSYEERMRAVQLYVKYDMSIATVICELGYPSRQMLYLWYKEFKGAGSLRLDSEHGHSKYTAQQREQAVEYYAEHGRNASRTIKALGFPRRTTLRDWIKEDLPDGGQRCVTGKSLVRCTQEQKEQAVIRLCAGDGTSKEIADALSVAESSLRRWKKCLLNERCSAPVAKEQKASAKSVENHEDLKAERDALAQQVEILRNDIHRLQLERDILEKADEILKKTGASIFKH